MRDLSKRLNKSLIRDYISNPNQTFKELAIKYNYKTDFGVGYQINKYFSLSPKDKKIALKK